MIERHHPPESFVLLCFLYLLILVTSNTSCKAPKKESNYPSPENYNLNKPVVFKLPASLDEISGIVYYEKDSSVFAINDEDGFLFKIRLKDPIQVERWKFSDGGDYEDLTLVDSNFYVLKSKGKIEKVKFLSADSVNMESFSLFEESKNEFESLYFDKATKQLIVLCKDCDGDKKKQVASSWYFLPDADTFSSATASIDISKIKSLLKKTDDPEFELKASAAGMHPATGELFIVSAVNKALIILDKNKQVKNVYQLDPGYFKQPEGLAFTADGDLLISNEAAESGHADILFFKYNQNKKQ